MDDTVNLTAPIEEADAEYLAPEQFLSNYDNPNFDLSTTLLNEHNYNHWKRSDEISLDAKSKLRFVDGSCRRPTPPSPNCKKWDRCNSMAIYWLLHSVKKNIAESVLYCRTASQIWKELSNRFEKHSRTCIYQVQRELNMISQGNSSVSSYFTKLKSLWDKYFLLIEGNVCDCGSSTALGKVLLDQQIVQFLMGLNEVYNNVRGSVLMISPAPNLDEVYQIILQEEEHCHLGNSVVSESESDALAAQRNAQRTNFNMELLYCDHCKSGGHSMEKCYKLHGYPPGSRTFCDHCKVK